MVIILAICIPVTALVTGFFTLKGVHMGLKWQYEMKHEQKPEMDSPIAPVVNPFINEKQEKQAANIMEEWLNGPQESR